MDLKLSWDLFIIVFFAIVTAYSFIIGRKETLKIIIATYIATISADGLGNVFQQIANQSSFFMKLSAFLGYSGGIGQFASILKVLIFIAIIVLLVIYGDYQVDDPPDQHSALKLATLTVLSLLSGGLILSTIIVFANGGSLISGTAGISESFKEVYEQSRFVRGLLDWHDVWFALPGLLFVAISIFQRNRSE
ncbi:hypothetical protein IT411_04095 [Candidatus Peregrinibacteria bacterium]|nr:hypothetical protein [Candidatus Peregrinibacteria bacterium]